ncbi:Putative fibronectin type III, lipase, GDSL, active, immunoglobulin-like, SGNH hydrolase superfamily [Septoria linicola]|uniref:Fibronectin type III, lipase, GDSL, active, immunoglobulin-like, SGNH hydrolase superfamily n=1 Tax=Septoria linicola TaxID=215465 RepID=A0A9Q9AHJ8_9PEZI|nr:putative fibronectin type III, lipase, GDSL, active, immunoglobulin-like, SGNH hydrolase superfamily [Septoria linicola]USW49205.1 Putative fibronectin type III, lipase, GDSL, active, immunoglobulin-like, SGNH hydrolase superfamily [Septoria linicola]
MANAQRHHHEQAMDDIVSSSLAQLSIHNAEQDLSKKHRKILILGDSITHGGEGDYTWRYRLWQWFKQESLLASSQKVDTRSLGSQESLDAPSRQTQAPESINAALSEQARCDPNLKSLMELVATGDAPKSQLTRLREHVNANESQARVDTPTSSRVLVSFVGPYTGVKGRDPPTPIHPAPLPGEDDPAQRPAERIPWGYSQDVDTQFAGGCRHFATWGYQAFQCKEAIAEVVRDWQPDLVLSLLGFNDVGWWVSDADGTLESIRAIVENTRAVKADVDFAFGNIVNRTYLEGREDLLENTKRFNDLLPVKAEEWTKKGSRVISADVASQYDSGPQYRDWAPAAYDGLHPSALGEYQIAKAFSIALHREFKFGSQPLSIPSTIPKRNLQAPAGVESRSTPMGVRVIWTDVYGAEYQVRHRKVDQADWSTNQTQTPRTDIEIHTGEQIEVQVRSCHGFEHGPWTEICKCKCTHKSIPAPRNVKTRSTASGFSVTWSPPPSIGLLKQADADISRYEVLYKDGDRGDMFPTIQGASETSATVKDLPSGHVIDLILVRAWIFSQNAWSFGQWASGRAVRVGDHSAPRRPLDLRIEGRAGQDGAVKLAWDRSGDKSAAGYLVYVRALDRGVAETAGVVVRETRKEVGCMGHAWNYEFSVSAVNGEWESERSAGVVPPRD